MGWTGSAVSVEVVVAGTMANNQGWGEGGEPVGPGGADDGTVLASGVGASLAGLGAGVTSGVAAGKVFAAGLAAGVAEGELADSELGAALLIGVALDTGEEVGTGLLAGVAAGAGLLAGVGAGGLAAFGLGCCVADGCATGKVIGPAGCG